MNGLISIQSSFPVKETIDRLVSIIESREMTVFARIDHAKNAMKQGLTLRPTELIIFGNPKVGTLLMQDQQTSGIDLPVRALGWEDEQGKSWLSYNDTNWIAERHALSTKSEPVIKAITEAMTAVAFSTTKLES